MQKTERILRDAGLPANAVPPRLLLPIVEHCSVEDNETLREMWAGLLATASQQTDAVSPSFIETLKQLTPDDARHLERVRAETLLNRQKLNLAPDMPLPSWVFSNNWSLPRGVTSDTFERLGLIRREFDVKLHNTNRTRQPSSIDEALDLVEPDMRYRFVFTQFAFSSLEACHGPLKSDENKSREDTETR